MDIKRFIKSLILYVPRRVHARRVNAQYSKLPKTESRQRRIIRKIQAKQHVNVMFIASSLTMWRYGSTIDTLAKDSRFSVHVVITPFSAFTQDERLISVTALVRYFESAGIKFTIANTRREFKKIKHLFRPDIIFYPQPYDFLFPIGIDWRQNVDCLLAYIPYSLGLSSPDWGYDLDFHNAIWRQYLPSAIHLKESREHSRNHGINGVVVGEPRADELRGPQNSDPWKKINDGVSRKRLIWAPHFRILENEFFNRPDFLWTADVIINMAKKYGQQLQIAFKPHPRLKTALYELPEWGKERTDEYYHLWENMDNTQVEEGEYTDLFKTSDALIHNCGSFTGEYLYTKKPVAYISKDIESLKAPYHAFGRRCVEAHYAVSNEEEIERFIVDVVLGGHDTLKDTREKVFNELLATPNNRSVGENIHDDLVKSLGLH